MLDYKYKLSDYKNKEIWYLDSFGHNIQDQNGIFRTQIEITHQIPIGYTIIQTEGKEYIISFTVNSLIYGLPKPIFEAFLSEEDLINHLHNLKKENESYYNDLITKGNHLL